VNPLSGIAESIRPTAVGSAAPGEARISVVRFDWGSRTFVMGVINYTPDSFSGDGLGGQPSAAVALARQMASDGADIIDVGGMSSRPGHQEISVQDEVARVMEVLPEIVGAVDIPVSIDTYRYPVAEAAVHAGARMINDIWGLKRDPKLAQLAAARECMMVLMHNQEGTEYGGVVTEVIDSLRRSVAIAEAAGVPRDNVVLDPGIGFGKTAEQNLEVLRRLNELTVLGLPILVGTSRKSTIGKVLGLPADDRIEGTAATVALAIAQGADIVRVHDVAPMVRVARMSDAVVRGTWKEEMVTA
jgi:dihydropteroate synthase